MTYADFVAGSESPDGRDNAAGSGAFSKYQFMPATAAELARRTPWGAGATPDTVKALVMADPSRADQLFNLYNAGSKDALARANLPTDNPSMLALHRFGQSGGVSLLQAPGNMPVTQWVNSVNWGPGVAADAVIKQNGLNRYADVSQLRSGFLGAPKEASVASMYDAPAPAPAPVQPAPFTRPAINPAAIAALADAFTPPQQKRAKPRPLFG